MKFLQPLMHSLLYMGYFGPLLMGIMDSSFLILPFGNDLLVVGLIAQDHKAAALYVLSAACGSTIGAVLLAVVARHLGEKGITRITGKRRYERLRRRMEGHGGVAIAVGGLAPPPFPFTTVIAGAAALNYPLWRIAVINFIARGLRFTLLAYLAIRFGAHVISFATTNSFEWVMGVFITSCLAASAYSIAKWLRKSNK